MSTAQWILNLALLWWVLTRNLGTRAVTRATFGVPALVVAVVAATYLRDVPTLDHDAALELTGLAVGAALGLAAAGLTRVHRRDGRLVVTAGAGFALLWLAVIGGRVAFAEWATHTGARTVGEFSVRHQITGADAWTAAFVLMAVAMVVVRYGATALVAGARARRTAVAPGSLA